MLYRAHLAGIWYILERGCRCRGCDRMVVGFRPTGSVQSVPITTKAVSSNPAHGEVCSIQHHVIQFFSDLRQVGVFLRVVQFPQAINLTATT
jgi:hypothetical protein